jgi:hypothetical protein
MNNKDVHNWKTMPKVDTWRASKGTENIKPLEANNGVILNFLK